MGTMISENMYFKRGIGLSSGVNPTCNPLGEIIGEVFIDCDFHPNCFSSNTLGEIPALVFSECVFVNCERVPDTSGSLDRCAVLTIPRL